MLFRSCCRERRGAGGARYDNTVVDLRALVTKPAVRSYRNVPVTMVGASLSLGGCPAGLYPAENSCRAAVLVGGEPGWAARHVIALGYAGRPRGVGRRVIPRGRSDTDERLHIC